MEDERVGVSFGLAALENHAGELATIQGLFHR
jgi:hypothetical protein